MPSIVNHLLALATITTLAISSAIPDTSLANPLAKRADLTCPGSDGTNYRGPRGGDWTIHCNEDTKSPGTKQKTVSADSFQDCINICGSTTYDDWCRFAVYTANVNEAGPCYLKQGNGGGYNSVKGTKTAQKHQN